MPTIGSLSGCSFSDVVGQRKRLCVGLTKEEFGKREEAAAGKENANTATHWERALRDGGRAPVASARVRGGEEAYDWCSGVLWGHCHRPLDRLAPDAPRFVHVRTRIPASVPQHILSFRTALLFSLLHPYSLRHSRTHPSPATLVTNLYTRIPYTHACHIFLTHFFRALRRQRRRQKSFFQQHPP